MFCKKCGAYNDENARVCTVCQSSFADIDDDNSEKNSEGGKNIDINITRNIKSYFWPSVILTFLGSIPFGIVAMVLANIVEVNIESENFDIAKMYSKRTLLFCYISLFVGIVKYVSILFWIGYYFMK